MPGARSHGTVMVLAGPNHGALFVLDEDVATIGRGRGTHICIADEGLSRLHARIRRTPDGFSVEDANSKNGTFLGTERIKQPHFLRDGDRIALGANTVLRFALQDHLERDASRKTIELTIRDPLTQVFNRRHLEDRMEAEFGYAVRHDSPLHMLMIDLDHFKEVNDTYGHQAGDKVLRQVADALKESLRLEDILGRYGGEEFLIITRGIDDEGVQVVAERLRENVEALEVHSGDDVIRVTTCIGVAERSGEHRDAKSLVKAADDAMYRAKNSGRNRVELA